MEVGPRPTPLATSRESRSSRAGLSEAQTVWILSRFECRPYLNTSNLKQTMIPLLAHKHTLKHYETHRKGDQVLAAVRKVLTLHDGKYSSGGRSNAMCVVRASVNSTGASIGGRWCYNTDCRISLLANKKRECKHVKALMATLAEEPGRPCTPGLRLDGFLAFVPHALDLEKRACSAEYCMIAEPSASTDAKEMTGMTGLDPTTRRACSNGEVEEECPILRPAKREGMDSITVDDIMSAKKKTLIK